MTEQARADADGGWKDIIEDFTPEFFESLCCDFRPIWR